MGFITGEIFFVKVCNVILTFIKARNKILDYTGTGSHRNHLLIHYHGDIKQ
jgi:hypothetical protein